MNNFIEFKNAVQKQLDSMSKFDLFQVEIDPDSLWETYLNSFDGDSNPIFRERTEHDCNCCKRFIRQYGSIVAVDKKNKLLTIWDVIVSDPYQKVANNLSKSVRNAKINNVFRNDSNKLGVNRNRDAKNAAIVWDHFYCEVDKKFVVKSKDLDSVRAQFRSTKDVTKRGLEEITIDSLTTVLELIDQNSLYRGSEHQETVLKFSKLKSQYENISNENERDNFAWVASVNGGGRIRNSAIGTLLVDLSKDISLEEAVRKFESVVAPTNYKRPKALVTKKMIEDAQKTVQELGIEPSLYRRHASIEDITINNLLFANQRTKMALNVFDELSETVGNKKPKNLNRVEEVHIDKFISDILPKADSIELMVNNSQLSNFMSLIAPKFPDSKNILKWNNNFSWTYSGSLTDSIKEKVKRAGGDVSGILRCSLEWFNLDDLDIHVIEPNKNEIYYGNKQSFKSKGKLDVDMNVSPTTRSAVENVTWNNPNTIMEGRYVVQIHNFTPRETVDVGFNVEIATPTQNFVFGYDKAVVRGSPITVAEFDYFNGEIKIVKSIKEQSNAREHWGVHTNTFQKVSCVLKSPNHWDDNKVGNLHWFFLLEGCKNPDSIRGLFNEYLDGRLDKHRKVFEVLGNKLMVKPSDSQLSGVGFSSTKRDSVLCRVSGSFNRTIMIKF
jgi:hypothetical protein